MVGAGEESGMFFRWWREHAPVFGTAAQWAGGLAAFGTFCVALWGVSKAVPYFENLNLREEKAELLLSVRGLRKEKTDLEAELTAQKERLAVMEASHRDLLFKEACNSVNRILQSLEASHVDGGHQLLSSDRPVFGIAEGMLQKSRLPPEDVERVRREWLKLRDEGWDARAERLLLQETEVVEALRRTLAEQWGKGRKAEGGASGPPVIADPPDNVAARQRRLREEIVNVCISAQKSD